MFFISTTIYSPSPLHIVSSLSRYLCTPTAPSNLILFYRLLFSIRVSLLRFHLISNTVSSLALTTCVIAKPLLAKRMLPRNAHGSVMYEDDLSQLRNHTVRLFHNVINRRQYTVFHFSIPKSINLMIYSCLSLQYL